MTIMDKRFAAEVVTARGKIYKFDAAECMANFLKDNPAIAADPNSTFLVNDFSSPETFRDARKAWFLRDSSFRSPMGGNLAAFQSRQNAVARERDRDAKVMDWTTLLKQGK
jgi:copper chaperone NosL